MKRIGVIAIAIAALVLVFFMGRAPEAHKRSLSQSSTLSSSSLLKKEASVGMLTNVLSLVKLPGNMEFKAAKGGNKVMLSGKERDEANSALADRKQIDGARAVLLQDESALNERTEQARFEAVDFLAAGMLSEDNPSRDYVLSAVAEVLSSDNVFRTNDMEQRKSLAGDKAELFDVLLQVEPSRAMELFEKSRGTQNFGIFRFAKGNSEFKNGRRATP